MTPVPNVVVKKDGFFAAIARGFFGLLTTVVVCATGLGLYTMHVIDKKFTDIRSLGESVVGGMPRWRESLPPVLSDAINDSRAADYASQVEVRVKLVDGRKRDRQRAVVDVINHGHETISLLSLNVRLENGEEIPVSSFVSYAATPLAFPDGNWRGPILPGGNRRYSTEVYVSDFDLSAVAEIADLRIAKPAPVPAPATREAGPVTSEDKGRLLELANRDDE